MEEERTFSPELSAPTQSEKSELTPLRRRRGLPNWGNLIDQLKELYPSSEQSVFYSADATLHQLISRETVNNILALARERSVIALPNREENREGRAFYSQEEIIEAVEYYQQLKSKRGAYLIAKSSSNESKKRKWLTIKKTTEQLSMPTAVFCRLIKEGQLSLGGEVIDQSVLRVKRAYKDKRRFINPNLLQKDEVQKAVEKWQNRHKNLDNLNYYVFSRNRGFYATVWQVARAAGSHPVTQRGDIERMAALLRQVGIKVQELENITNRGRYWVLLKDDQEKAVQILQASGEIEDLSRKQIEQICGPIIEAPPTTWQLKSQTPPSFLAVAPILRAQGIRLGGRWRLRISDLFPPESPVSIFKYRKAVVNGKVYYSYFFPVEQTETMRQFVKQLKS